MIIPLIIISICSALFWLGGFCWLPARRFIMPSIITGYCFIVAHTIVTHNWLQLTQLAVIGIFCLGYGEKSPLRHIFGNGWGRGVWGILAGICLSLELFLTGHLALIWFLLYLVGCFTLENALKNIPETIGDPLIGLGFTWFLIVLH